MEIGFNLKRVLKEKGITAYKISKDLNINESLIYQILRGDVKNPRVLTIKIIADYLEVSVNELIGGNKKKRVREYTLSCMENSDIKKRETALGNMTVRKGVSN